MMRRDEIRDIVLAEAEAAGVNARLLFGDCRRQRVASARHAAMWKLRQIRREDGAFKYSLPQIGRVFNRDHTTVLSGIRRHEDRLANATEPEDVTMAPLSGGAKRAAASVYIVAASDAGPVKVGISSKPAARALQLSIGSDRELCVAYASSRRPRADAQFVERAAHLLLKDYAARGEWFNCSIKRAEEAISDAERLLERARA